MRIRIAWDWGEIFARLDDTPGARAMLAALPIRATASTRGAEVYLSAPLRLRPDGPARQAVEAGTVCYWPEGASIALPFGAAPDARRQAPGHVLGRLEDDPQLLARIRTGHLLTVSRAEEPAGAPSSPARRIPFSDSR